MSLRNTRKILDNIHEGHLDDVEYKTLPIFNLNVPKSMEGVPDQILDPRNTWEDQAAYDETVKGLAAKFQENFVKYQDNVPHDVLRLGGPTLE